MEPVKLIYLASPYSKYPGGREEAFRLVCKKAAELMIEGYRVFCPIAHSHPIEEHGMDDLQTGDFWLRQDFAILDKCDEVHVYQMPSWEISYGVGKEVWRAHELGIPVKFIPFDYNTEGFGL